MIRCDKCDRKMRTDRNVPSIHCPWCRKARAIVENMTLTFLRQRSTTGRSKAQRAKLGGNHD